VTEKAFAGGVKWARHGLIVSDNRPYIASFSLEERWKTPVSIRTYRLIRENN
jgi:hypothetical protein